MMHVKQITELVTSGQADAAHQALDTLLAFGPNNVAALKLRAMLFESEGLFEDEAYTWERILNVDRNDQDALNYLFRRQNEDREHFYFTDEIPGGRRFLAYPHKFISTAIYGLVGCLAFFICVHLLTHFKLSQVIYVDETVLALFGICVLWPWLAIIRAFLVAPRFVTVTNEEISLSTRFRTVSYKWEEIAHIYLAKNISIDEYHLSLVVAPKELKDPILHINLTPGLSIIRARHYFLAEIRKYHPNLDSQNLADLKLENPKHFQY